MVMAAWGKEKTETHPPQPEIFPSRVPSSTPVMSVTQDTAHRRTTESCDMSCPHCIEEKN